MPCTTIEMPGGVRAIVCSRGGRGSRAKCSHPDCTGPADFLCDYETGMARGKIQTCDAKLCRTHARPAGENRHMCPAHSNRPAPIGDLFHG